MKLALRYIPTEVWVDVIIFPWIKRKKLGKIVHMFRNRQFVEILQYCLHERGKRTLGTFYLDKQRLPYLPRTPLPKNIKFFEYIRIRHVDAQTLEFLRQFNPLFTGVNLHFHHSDRPKHDLTNLRTLLGHLSPLIDGINSMEFNQCVIPLVQEYFGPKLAQFKRMKVNNTRSEPFDPATCINFFVNWLTMGDYNEPRFLEIDARYSPSNPTFFQQFAKATQQQFQSAKCASTFAIHINNCYGQIHHITEFHLENTIGEELHGHLEENLTTFQIVRHQANASKAMQEWIEQIVDERGKSNNVIEISCPLTIGQIDAIAANEEDGKRGENQPSTSNKT